MTDDSSWGDTHVIPIDDLKEHECRPECWCRPSLGSEGAGRYWVHNSLDGRERFEGLPLQ